MQQVQKNDQNGKNTQATKIKSLTVYINIQTNKEISWGWIHELVKC